MPTVTFISSIPAFDFQESVDSTPKSFSDIPVILKHQEKNVRVMFEPQLEGYQSAVQGTLYILTSVLVFMPDSGAPGFQIEYRAITLHAISRGESGPSIYCQLDETACDAGASARDEGDEDDAQMRELIIVPEQPESLEMIFEALSQCASLHPDPEEEDGGGDALLDESAFETFSGTEDQELSEVGRAALQYMESIICDPHHLLSNEITGDVRENGQKVALEETAPREIKVADDTDEVKKS